MPRRRTEGTEYQSRRSLADQPVLVVNKRAVGSLTLEHFGTSEWIDDEHGYRPTGGHEATAVWHSDTPIALPLVDSIVSNDLRHVSALRPAGS